MPFWKVLAPPKEVKAVCSKGKNAVGFNTPGAARSAADLEAQDFPKSKPKPEKIDVEKQHVFGIDF